MYKFTSLTVLVCLIASPIFAQSTVSCGSSTCPSGNQCCGSTCYDPSQFSCPVGSAGPILCGYQHLPDMTPDYACGTVCYDSIGYTCCDDVVYSSNDTSNPCLGATSAPTTAPTSAPTAPPTSGPGATCGSATCPSGNLCCGSTCYDPHFFSCPVGSVGPILCGFQHLPDKTPDYACGSVCYDSIGYTCCDNVVYNSNDTSNPCLSTATAAPTTAPTAAATPTPGATTCGGSICHLPNLCCGSACYDPNYFSCPVGSVGPILCGFQHLPDRTPDYACGSVCYDSIGYTCCDNVVYSSNDTANPCLSTNPATVAPTQAATPTPAAGTCGSSTCPSGNLCCGSICYDPNFFSCPVGSVGPILCGFQHLPDKTPDYACGTVCYDSIGYTCCDNVVYNSNDTANPCLSTNPATVAPTVLPTQGATPTPGASTCGSAICPAGNLCCGSTCYDPNFFSCPVGSVGPILCGFQHLPDKTPDYACGSVCYDSIGYTCCDNVVYSSNDTANPCLSTNPATVAPTVLPTQGATPTPGATTCGAATCPAGNLCCGSTCYDPNFFSCPVGSVGPILCGFQHLPDKTPDYACGTVCYDSIGYTCCNDVVYSSNDTANPCSSTNPATVPPTVIPTSTPTSPASLTCGSSTCPAGNECCGSTCYDPNFFSCPVGSVGPILCGYQHLPDKTPDYACGSVCYDSIGYTCCDNVVYSSNDTANPCGATAAPTTAPSSAPTSAPTQSSTCGGAVCASGDQCCDNKCYDPALYSCVQGSQGFILCGFQHLPSTTPDGACGMVCYDTLSYTCCNNNIYSLNETSPCSKTPVPTSNFRSAAVNLSPVSFVGIVVALAALYMTSA